MPQHVTITRYAYDELGIESSFTEHQVLDGLGRVVQNWRADEAGVGWVVTEEVKDLSGAPWYTSYPHRESSFVADLTQTSDNRILSRTFVGPFGDTWEAWEDEHAGYGHVVTSYPDPGVVRTVDADGRVHEARHDAQGRLVEVWEGVIGIGREAA